MNERILLLSCNTGQGHNSTAKALAEEFARRGAVADIRDALAFASPSASRFVSGVHNMSAVYAPALFSIGNRSAIRATARAVGSQRPSGCYLCNALYAKRLYTHIRQNGYAAVVTPHVFPAEALTAIRRRFDLPIPVAFVATDYSCAPYVGETQLDLYCIAHPKLSADFVRWGVPRSRIAATGIPVRACFRSPMEKGTARALLGLPQEAAVILIMTGSMGNGHTGALLEALLPRLPQRGLVLVMGGSNERLKRSLRGQYQSDPRVRVLDYCGNVETYLRAADVLLTKPGGLSCTEALVSGIPLVLTTPLPCWEAQNTAFFTSRGMACTADSPEALAAAACNLLRDPAARQRMLLAQKRNARPRAAVAVCDLVLGQIWNASRGTSELSREA